VKKLFLATNYLLYRLKSTSEHGVHSPFVFDLVTNVIYNKVDFYVYKEIEAVRTHLLESEKTIEFEDLGAGSHKSKNRKRTIEEILKYSVKPKKYSQLLFRLVNHFQPAKILELGTSLGITTSYLAKANEKATVISIEGSKEIAAIATKNLSQLDVKNVEQLIGNFDELLPSVLNKIENLDFIFFDGNHQKEATLNYFNQCLAKANENSVFVFDDIYWSSGMKQAWQEIKNNKNVTVTIDLFFMGIVFFRTEQVKQHFIIKY
jgi:predicted O-methyltransferase YrrM